MWLANRFEQAQAKAEGEGTLGIVDLPFPTVHKLLHSLMPGTQPLNLLSVCMYGLFDTSLRHKVSHVVGMH